MKKRVTYRSSVRIDATKKVIDGTCECPGGMTPACCKHVFALLAAVEDYSRQELYKAPTDKLQAWHQPKPKLVSPRKVKEVYTTTNVPVDTRVDFSALSFLPPTTPIFSCLSVPGSNQLLFSDQVGYQRSIPLPAFPCVELYNDALPGNMNLDLILLYHSRVRCRIDSIIDIEASTIGQNCEKWKQERLYRITASNVHAICSSTNLDATASVILKSASQNLDHIPAINFGKRAEPMVKNLIRFKFTNHVFRNTGLVIHPVYNFVAGSPDGFLYNVDDSMLLEVKCLFNPRRLSIQELIKTRKNFCLEVSSETGQLVLKTTHAYYYQIQCQLFCSHLSKCLFAVFHNPSQPLHLEVIYFNPQFWSSNFDKLCTFYFQHYLPKLVNYTTCSLVKEK